MTPSFSIGSDPELFLFTTDTNKLKSSVNLIGGSKHSPAPMSKEGFYVQEDNVAVEFNIPPAYNAEEFASSLKWAMGELDQQLSSLGLCAKAVASAEFPEEELQHPQAWTFGCDPDFNAWTGRVNPRPKCGSMNLRTAGGHVHVGVTFQNPIDRVRLIRLMDLFLGVPSVLMDHDVRRSSLYGKAGAFRPTKYGVEYRVLSNFWLKSEELMKWVYNQTARSIESLVNNNLKAIEESSIHIINAINDHDVKLADKLVNDYQLATV